MHCTVATDHGCPSVQHDCPLQPNSHTKYTTVTVAATKHIWPGLVVAPDQGGVNAVGDSVLDVAW